MGLSRRPVAEKESKLTIQNYQFRKTTPFFNTQLKKRINFSKMSESHFDQYEHYNYDQDKAIFSGHSGKQRSKKEAAMNTNKHNPGGHERKIVNKLMNAEKNGTFKEARNGGQK